MTGDTSAVTNISLVKITDNNTTPKMFIGILNILATTVVCLIRLFHFLCLH